MTKFGTLKDFRLSLSRIKKEYGDNVSIKKSPNGAMRWVFVNKVNVLSIAKLNSRKWVFIYNSKFWKEK
jgi:hypothetical protein